MYGMYADADPLIHPVVALEIQNILTRSKCIIIENIEAGCGLSPLHPTNPPFILQ
jgi:hypothetical protein